MPFCSFKNALLYSLTKCSYSKCPFEKGILNKGILSRDIEGHFWKGSRAFPPNRQKPYCAEKGGRLCDWSARPASGSVRTWHYGRTGPICGSAENTALTD